MRIIVVLSFLTIYSSLCGQSFREVTVNPAETVLKSVAMVSPSVGYAGGEKGIYKTVDGGETWQLQPDFVNPAPGNSYDFFNNIHLHFFNESEGIAYGWHAFNKEMILQTTDGGEHWVTRHLVNPGTNGYPLNTLNSATFQGDKGWIVGNNGRFLETTDRGVTWTASVLFDAPELFKVQALTETRIVTGGYFHFLISEDAGANWTKVVTPFDCSDFHFFDEHVGIAISGGSFYKTTDGGRTWKPHLFETDSWLTDIAFYGQTAYAIANRTIYKSNDRGETWLQVYSGSAEITSIGIVSPLKALFTTRGTKILITTNGAVLDAKEPIISTVSISTGYIGQAFTISGNNFEFVTEVLVNGVPAPLKLVAGVIQSKIPSNSVSGKVELRWPGGSVFSSSTIEISNAPILHHQTLSSNTHARLSGENLAAVNELMLEDHPYPFTVIDNNSIEFDLPANYFRNALKAVVKSPHGSYSRTYDVFHTPFIRSFLVDGTGVLNTGSKGKAVTVNGSGFKHATGVQIGSLRVSNFEIITNDVLKFFIPATDTLLAAPIRILSPSGIGSSATDIVIYPPPVINHLSPLRFRAGDELRIEGKYLTSSVLSRVVLNDAKDVRISHRIVNDETAYFTIPQQIEIGSELKIQYTNAGGATTTVTYGVVIDGVRPYFVSTDNPLITTTNRALIVRGFFPYYLDSVRVDGRKVSFFVSNETLVDFFVSGEPGVHHFSFYDDGRAIIEDHPFTIVSRPPLSIGEMSPLVVSPGSEVGVRLGPNQADLLSVDIGGLKASFRTENEYLYVTIPECALSSHVTVTSLSGSVVSEKSLTVVPTGRSAPQIFSTSDPVSDGTGTFFHVKGNNFSALTHVRVNEHPVDFKFITDDSLIVYLPKVAMRSTSFNSICVESPFGTASKQISYSVKEERKILSVSKSSGKRGEVLLIKLEPKDPIIHYSEVNRFIFGSVSVYEFAKLDDDTYLLNVPATGDVNGLIGLAQFGLVQYSTFTFTLSESSGYCDARGGGNHQTLNSVSIGGIKFLTSAEPYIDRTAEPVQVAPEQPVRLDLLTYFGAGAAVYVDWDNDTNFTKNEAILFKFNSHPQADTAIHAFFTVPSNVPFNIPIRMRVVTNHWGSRDDVSSCGYTIGQVADFALMVVPGSNGFQIFDFFPSVGTTNTIVTVTGSGLSSLSEVTIGGVNVTVNHVSDSRAEFIITDEAESGAVTFISTQGEVANSRGFVVDRTILPPDDPDADLKYVYRATVNGGDVPFFISHWNGADYYLTTLDAVNRTNGVLCYYTPAGSHCNAEPVTYQPSLSGEPPLTLAEGQEATLYGENLFSITSLSLNGVSVPYINPNSNSVIVTVPENASSGKLLLVTVNGSATIDIVITPSSECKTVSEVWTEGLEIVKVAAGEFSATSEKNTTEGISDYTSLVMSGDPYARREVSITISNFSATQTSGAIEVYLRPADGSPAITLDHFNLGPISIPPGSQIVMRGWIDFPDDLQPGTHVLVFKLMYSDSRVQCVNFFGEKELYSCHLNRDAGNCLAPYIAALSPSSAFIGETVDIYGANLAGTTAVRLGELPTNFTVVSDDHLQMVIPPGATTSQVVATNGAETAKSPMHLVVRSTQAILRLDPVFGESGDQINIYGSNLSDTRFVHFGGQQATSFTIMDNSWIVATVPPLAVTDFVTVTGPDDIQSQKQKVFFICDGLSYNQYCRINQTISFAELPAVSFTDRQLTLDARATSGLPVTYVSSEGRVASISGNVVYFHSAGNVTISAVQGGNYMYHAAPEVSHTLTVGKAEQTIIYDVPDLQLSDLPLDLSTYVEASSHLSLGFDVQGNVRAAESVIFEGTPGPVTVTASQPGNENYLAAIPVVIEFCILPPKPQIIPLNEEGRLAINTTFDVMWYREGILLEDERNADLALTEDGLYTARIDAGGCVGEESDAVEVTITDLEPGIELLPFYPNPFHDEIVISSPIPIQSFRLLSPVGVTVCQGTNIIQRNGKYVIELESIASGAYILELKFLNGLTGRSKVVRE